MHTARYYDNATYFKVIMTTQTRVAGECVPMAAANALQLLYLTPLSADTRFGGGCQR